MISIDQNCHSLWDVVPKLQALAAHGKKVRHFIEDIDVAFTSAAAEVESALFAWREQYHTGGIADWGAALFYSEFLGRLPMDIRLWEPYTGMKTAAAARRLGREVGDLYDEFSRSDNWQLIGPSYVGDRDHHRVIGDLSVAETGDFVRQIVAKARANCMETFVQDDCRRRLSEWFDRESQLVDDLLDQYSDGQLVDLYRCWLSRHVDRNVAIEMTSSLFACGAESTQTALLEAFLKDYDLAAGLYNEAVGEAGVHLRALRSSVGELPFFATLDHQGHLVRTAVHLDGDELRIGRRRFRLAPDRRLPLDDLASGGVHCLAGKAIVLAIQARLGPDGDELALPYRGSEYMPAAVRLGEKLAAAGLLPGELRPIVRVRFGLLDHLRDIDGIIHLPEHLRGYFGRDEVPASQIGRNYASLAKQAAERLGAFRDEGSRIRWQRESFPDVAQAVEELDRQRRRLAQMDPKSPEIRALGKRQKRLQLRLFEELLKQISRDAQAAEIDYWDSRGALLPWCVALGGGKMYNRVIAEADIYTEAPQQPDR